MSQPTSAADERVQVFLRSLMRELFQTETSAAQHCRREAARLGQTPPAEALRAVSVHAEAVLADLPQLAERNGLPNSRGGLAVGELFSQLRDKLADALIDSDRSYRGTLLGCRHGLDVVRMLQHVSATYGLRELDAFCASWLNTRTVLVQKLEEELVWFARNPAAATRPGRRPLSGREVAS